MTTEQKRRVTYYYDTEIGHYHYGPQHPMKPHRVRMTHSLVLNYNMYNKMQVVRPPKASAEEMTKFHSDEYIQFLERCTPDTVPDFMAAATKFNTGPDCDCPIFDGLFEFCSLSAGGSIAAAQKLNHGDAQIAINWGGGLHHAKKCEASGFCYVNDIVLGILELLKYNQRVLYIDIDAHHGDGVEEAFFTTDRVMTVSFHKFGEFFPGMGDVRDVGYGKGKYYSVNFPLRDGIDDETYQSVFEPVMAKVMERFRPGAVVLQCGADSLAGDRLGCFNLSMKGHSQCVRFMKTFNVPLMILGGGGYTIRNVARAWTAETGIAIGEELDTDLPFNDYYEYYGPHYHLDVPQTNMENLNTKEYLHKMKTIILENLNHINHAPSVQMHSVPQDTYAMDTDSDGDDPDVRNNTRVTDKMVVPANEYEESDTEL